MTIIQRALMGGTAGLALAAAASAAAAQDFCGGASANGQWIGGAEGTSDVATAGAPMEQMALALMQNEYVALFSVSAPTEVRLEAQGRGSGDPVIDLRDEAGAIVASDDDSGGNGASRAETALQPGHDGGGEHVAERPRDRCAEHGAVAGHQHVAARGEGEPAADRGPVHHAQHGHRHGEEVVEHRADPPLVV